MRPRTDLRASLQRWLLHALVALAGVAAIVGSGGGLPGMPDYTGPQPGTSIPPAARLSVGITPSVVTVQPGGTAVFRSVVANATGTTSYQWSRDGVDIAGASASTYTLYGATLGDDGARFTVRVSASNGTAFATGQLRVVPLPAVAYEDGEFEPSAWTEEASTEPAQADATAAVTRSASGGNPGAFRRIEYRMPAGPAVLRIRHVALASSYDPSSQGPIVAIDFAVECIASGDDSRVAPLIEQGGRTFTTLERWHCPTSWQPAFALSNRGADTFLQLDGPACEPGATCLDFSASAAPIRFGLLTEGRVISGLPAVTIVQGVDNWKVTIRRN